MAGLEEALELLDESEEGIEAEADGEAEASEEMASEVKEASESVSKLRRSVDALKELNVPQVLKSFTKFIVKNAAIGAVLFGVNVALHKLYDDKGTCKPACKTIQQKQKKVKAIAELTSDVGNTLTKLTKWAKDNEDVKVEVSKGITVPLPDIISKYTDPMEKVSSFGN